MNEPKKYWMFWSLNDKSIGRLMDFLKRGFWSFLEAFGLYRILSIVRVKFLELFVISFCHELIKKSILNRTYESSSLASDFVESSLSLIFACLTSEDTQNYNSIFIYRVTFEVTTVTDVQVHINFLCVLLIFSQCSAMNSIASFT